MSSKETKMDLIIPIETMVREFHAKVYLALIAAERGFRVFIGDARMIRRRIAWFPVGAYFLDKSVVPNRVDLFRYYRALGFRIVAWCEEGLSLVDPDAYLQHRIHPEALAQAEMFFTWGPHQAAIIKSKYPELKDKITETGNPRIDILTPCLREVFSRDAETLRQRYPGMILINTNFSVCNHKKGQMAYMALLKSGGKIPTPEDEAFARGLINHKERLFGAFMDLVMMLHREFTNRIVVVRPHPSENHEIYHQRFAGLENVYVIHEGNVIPWLLAADVLIHNGCTTGVEASLLGRPVIAYQPFVSEKYDIDFPNRVSVRAYSMEDVRSEIQRQCKMNGDTERHREEALREHIHSVDGAHSEAIVERLYNNWKYGPILSFPRRTIMETRRLAFRLRSQLEGSDHDNDGSYEQQKFGTLELKEIDDLFRKFASQRHISADYNIRQLWKSCFEIYRID